MTTSARHTSELVARAKEVAERGGGRFVERRGSLATLLLRHHVSMAYVVGRDAESVQSLHQKLRVDVGLLHAKVASGTKHPLIRALGPVSRVVDGTLGLAGDALHISAVTQATVLATEASPWVAELVSAGLGGLLSGKWSEAVGRIEVHKQACIDLLASCGPVDAVFIAPMFTVPAAAAPGYDLFRQIADHRPLDPGTFHAARAIAKRVVVRVERHGDPPFKGMTQIRGKAVDYWVWVDGQSEDLQV